ncbi:energy-coupling factor ABC transporter permease [Halorhodospira neutriphila]|uniref:Cobalamin biosynthesis protein CbiM n=1 Tax=Halorhodospira neutriphila TaxID=168379 RepID=A0ABS1E867_9GAMM|nr:energy-coupling factor ABC transporter permease [Halorhodospira neutriphila]MBK1727004.1 cobalamin biosynthesis protein CbiM [Halorhodospira neutriphila]
MHIEPGMIAQPKVVFAGVAAAGVAGYYLRSLIRRPSDLPRIALAALFFSLFMQSFHMPVGPSELHFVGAMAIYLTLGFLPTLFGFMLGLLVQGILFNPADLIHWAVNSLSLIAPLIAVHYTLGKRYAEQGESLTWARILRLDAAYYSGVAAMVGLWLVGTGAELAAWAAWASSYAAIVAVEPVITYAAVRGLKAFEGQAWTRAFAVDRLRLAA